MTISSLRLTWLALSVCSVLSFAFGADLKTGNVKFILLSQGTAGSFCTVFNGSEHTTSPILGTEALVTTAGDSVFEVSYPGAGKPAEAHKWSLDFHLQKTVILLNHHQGMIGGPSTALETDGLKRLFYVGMIGGGSNPLEVQFTTVDMESGKSAVFPLATIGRLSQTAEGILIAFPGGRYRFIPFSGQTPYEFTVKDPEGRSYAPEIVNTLPLNGRRILRVLPTQIAAFSIPPNTGEVRSELIITSDGHPEIGRPRVLAGDKPTIFYARNKGDSENPTYSEIVSLDPENKSTTTIALGRRINDFLPVALNKLVIIEEDGNVKEFQTETGAVSDLLKLDAKHLHRPKSAWLAPWGP